MAPNKVASDLTFIALGKRIGAQHDYFDGVGGAEETTFSAPEAYTGKRLDDAKVESDFYQVLDWKTLFKTVTIRSVSKVGDEDASVVVMAPEKGNPVTEYISTKTFLILECDTLESSSTMDISLPETTTFGDYRLVGGIMVPFRVVKSMPGMGDMIRTVKDLKFDVSIPASAFKPAGLKPGE
jgi:hypothetical protein